MNSIMDSPKTAFLALGVLEIYSSFKLEISVIVGASWRPLLSAGLQHTVKERRLACSTHDHSAHSGSPASR